MVARGLRGVSGVEVRRLGGSLSPEGGGGHCLFGRVTETVIINILQEK